MPTLDVFSSDAFSMRALTDAVNLAPYTPGFVSSLGLFEEKGVSTTTIQVEDRAGILSLVPTSARSTAGLVIKPNKRNLRSFAIPHYEVESSVMADEIQNVRAFGSESELYTVQTIVNDRLGDLTRSIDATLEWQRMGALRGTVLDADGTTVLSNLFTDFGVSQPTEVAFNFAAHTANDGAVNKKINGIVRGVQDAVGAMPVPGVMALCHSAFWDEFVSDPDVRAAYTRAQGVHMQPNVSNQQGGFLIEGHVRQAPFYYQGVWWAEYRGNVSSQSYVPADKALFFPIGVPGLFRTVFGPADFAETANTIGLPRYVPRPAVDPEFGRWVKLMVQMNAFSYCTRPGCLFAGRRGA